MAFYYLNHDSFGKTTNRAGAAAHNVRYNGDLSKTQLNEFLSTNEQYLAEHGVHRPEGEIEAHLAQLRQGRSPIGNAAHGTEHELTRSAAANAAYNARDEATYAVRSHVIPSDPQEAQAWFQEQERGERKNARMSDRFIGAMPRSLSPEQCLDVAEDFCRTVTQNRVPWHFALHLELDKKNDPDWNPHAHIIFRDRDIETGKRFLHTTAGGKERKELDAKGIEWWDTTKLREAWADALNRGFERYHINDHADHRSYKKQGIDKTPGIHLGPKANAVKRKGLTPESKDFTKGKRRILYTGLDNGTRADHNEQLKQASQEPKRDIHPQLRLLLDFRSSLQDCIRWQGPIAARYRSIRLSLPTSFGRHIPMACLLLFHWLSSSKASIAWRIMRAIA